MTDTGLDHPTAIKFHARARFLERLGVHLPLEEYERMVGAIRGGGIQPAGFSMYGRPFFKVRYGGATAYALWRHNLIVTFYPSPFWITGRGGKLSEWERVA